MNKQEIQIDGKNIEFSVLEKSGNFLKIEYNHKVYEFEYRKNKSEIYLNSGSGWSRISAIGNGEEVFVNVLNETVVLNPLKKRKKIKLSKNDLEDSMLTTMPGRVLKICVQKDEKVKKGQVLAVVEAMKMENEIKSTREGVIKKVLYKESDVVSEGCELFLFK